MTAIPAPLHDQATRRDDHALPAEVSERLGEVTAACRTYRVQALWLFGSAVQGTFDPATSDLDFLVDLGEYEPAVAERYGGLYMALADLFDRAIDLVTVRSPGNDHVHEAINATRQVLYAA